MTTRDDLAGETPRGGPRQPRQRRQARVRRLGGNGLPRLVERLGVQAGAWDRYEPGASALPQPLLSRFRDPGEGQPAPPSPASPGRRGWLRRRDERLDRRIEDLKSEAREQRPPGGLPSPPPAAD